MRTDLPATWFRLYAEFATDPKVQMLSEIDQRRFIVIMCLRCCNGSVTLQDSEVAFQLRISDQEWMVTKQTLLAKNLICDDNKPIAWEKRQFDSDTSNARVSKHREKKKQLRNVTVATMKRLSNAPETETETETETEETLSGKPDVPIVNGKRKLSEECNEVLSFLNQKTGKQFKPVNSNIGIIASRLREGFTVADCRMVIARKCREWLNDADQCKYLRPKTIFNATNFANYQGEIIE